MLVWSGDCLSRLEQGSPDPAVNDEGYFDRKVYCIDQSLRDLLQDEQHCGCYTVTKDQNCWNMAKLLKEDINITLSYMSRMI